MEGTVRKVEKRASESKKICGTTGTPREQSTQEKNETTEGVENR